MSQLVNSNRAVSGELTRAHVRALRNSYLLEVLTIAGYVFFTILAVAIFRENFIVLFIFNPMFYAFSSGQRQPHATRIGDLLNDIEDDFQINQGVTAGISYNQRNRISSENSPGAPENIELITPGRKSISPRNEASTFNNSILRGSITSEKLCRKLKKIKDSEIFTVLLMLSMASLFVYFIDVNGLLVRQVTHSDHNLPLGNDEIMLYASLFIVISCMALDPSLIICRIVNYYETSLYLNKIAPQTAHGEATMTWKFKSFLRRTCYLYNAPLFTKSKHMNVFLDQIEHIFIGSTDVIRTGDTPATFQRLREAGCRFWLMSEGEEKSVMEIARYSGLLVTNLKIKKIAVKESRDEETRVYLHDYEKPDECENVKPEVCYSSIIVLDGETYTKLSNWKRCSNKAMQWISGCKAFVGCNLSAEQKADILEKVGNCLAPEALTLAIGCQGEDSPMMRKADVSVGVQNHVTDDCEVDYVIHEFRTLNRLLLLHGMSSQRRMFHLRCFVLFESAALRTVQFIWVLSSFVPGLMNSIEIFGHATLYYVNWLVIFLEALFWIAAFLVYGPFYKYRGPNRKQRRPRELITRISNAHLYINASLKILMTFLGVALGTITFSFTVKTFQLANVAPALEALQNDTLPIPDRDYVTIDYLAGTNLMIVLCLILAMETRGWPCFFALIPATGYAVYWFFKSLGGVVITLPHGLEQTSAASSLLKLNFSYWNYSKIAFDDAWFLLTLGAIFVIVALIGLMMRGVFRQFRRKKYYNTRYSRRLIIGDRESDNPSLLSSVKLFCSYKLYPEVYRVYIALKTFVHFTGHLIKIYFKYKLRTALCIIAILQLMVFDNFLYMIGSIFGLAIPFLISLYELIKKKCSPGRAVRRTLTILDKKRGTWEEGGSKHIKAGDIILLRDGDMVPADSILLSSSDGEKCTFDQSFINGITKQNTCQTPQLTSKLTQAPEELCNLHLDIKLQDPWKQDATRFEAVITRRTIDDDGVPQFASTITSELNWLLGGYRIKGTEWAVSLVVYDRRESKINLDTKMYRKLIKKMSLEEFQYLGRFLLGLFTFFLFMLLVYSFIRFSAGQIKNSSDLVSSPDEGSKSVKTLFGLLHPNQTSVLSYLFGLIKIIPTPLLAILSFVRLFETELEINRDKTMDCSSETSIRNLIPDKSCFSIVSSRVLAWVPQTWKTWLSETLFLKIPTRVKSSSLNAFLGRVESVFIEKSGVLTKNHGNEYVALKKCSIGTKVFDLTNEIIALDKIPEELDEIFSILAISKDAYTSTDHNKVVNSPQFEVETALAEEVAQFGYEVKLSGIGLGHPNSTYIVASSHEHKLTVEFRGLSKSFRFLYRLPLDSVTCFIVRDLSALNGECQYERTLKNRIYASGDPEKLRKLLCCEIPEQAEKHMSDWTKEGFSTMLFAWRDITLEEFKSFVRDMESENQIKERAVRDILAENFNFLGSVSYYDGRKIIQLLHAAECRIAILTGDAMDSQKLRTFCNQILPCDCRLQHFVSELSDRETGDDTDEMAKGECGENRRVICINGETWENIFYLVDARKKLEKELTGYSWFVGYNLKAHHKKELLDLISKNVTPAKITMAIGNGLSDVPMLRRAHIGVVVRGEKPGEDVKDQADYVIGEFRFLKRLLHHGVIGKTNSFKLENILWYEILMFNMMPFVWYTTAILVAGNQTQNEPFDESYTLPFLGAMAIGYALLVYWSKRKVDVSLITDEKFSEEYVASRDHGRSNTLFYLIILGMVQCFGVKVITLLLFYAWSPSAVTENELDSAYLAFLSFVEATYHTCIQSGLLAYPILKRKRRLLALLPFAGWIIYLSINCVYIRQQPFIPEPLGFLPFLGRFLLGLVCIFIPHVIVIYIIRLAKRAQKIQSTHQKVFSKDLNKIKDYFFTMSTKISKLFQRSHAAAPENEIP